ncbi:bifunctional tRNA (5-methylaminomethyl-2-thiouridine)(34)-methyltransferase MnmD/FAD-dependent 5-carboxymethylaminomethyl-2-thiouridine(34) oxidoreductase MnmC [Arsenophonus apicola]|uniref:tRNA 5-methylaminomethyl-2-thiouridine biosynthesis bifunctional protein MnmC n=1 Tax=Arsenophonus apicola TaxID=2879119 RepID=A0ABY8P6A5_9GAMM|nr:bifunctional tRNA (5-methylaminomethyl-2-thiouridine)(34)-methyltransferase MnmD/FAD-dependent 5-carboxymethylaminomethyl-2-thiouridine(34) oxidoreductase MnmC [Arsenophonus apicola]WGO84461.1 bifunctional tRNA (5-methylaminomethyl-2-thiouridine)(34)-methyltransferase MnmD/FAD-dependent 5-carboxymethylaminomethyl-2-thiouridine(34) oxidoreductase MnmC [Arsenophonus apicola]
MNTNEISQAKLSWNEQAIPISEQFDDVYFCNQNGLEESRYVFLAGNQLPNRFFSHSAKQYVIAETGFGTGLNFMAVCQLFIQFRQQAPKNQLQLLHYISFEKYPLSITDLISVHQFWPELATFSKQICQQWPQSLPGCHRIVIENGAIILDLWFGDINIQLPQLKTNFFNKIDSWFLDGFAPAKNPEMWSEQLFTTMANWGRNGCTFATFTSAGIVRRGLEKAGFEVKKIKGFGRKREMLVGQLPANQQFAPQPWFARQAASTTEDIAIIGGGIASMMIALALLRRGSQITLYCQDPCVAQNASGNRQGALYPLLTGRHDSLERFFITAFTYAKRYYSQLEQLGIAFEHDWSGLVQLGYDVKSQQKIEQILTKNWPSDFARYEARQTLQTICGIDVNHDGIYYPTAGWLCPAELTCNSWQYAQQQGLISYFNHRLMQLENTPAGWKLIFNQGQALRKITHKTVIIANGHQLPLFSQTEKLPVSAVRGQVSHIPTTSTLNQLQTTLCYAGYLTPANHQYHCLGASYKRHQLTLEYSKLEQQENHSRLLNCLPDVGWTKEIDISQNASRQSIRCVTRDHLPMVGNVPNVNQLILQYAQLEQQLNEQQHILQAPVHANLFVIGALGARGLCSAPICAELLCSQIFAEPLPFADDILANLHPNRFWIRKLLQGRAVKLDK